MRLLSAMVSSVFFFLVFIAVTDGAVLHEVTGDFTLWNQRYTEDVLALHNITDATVADIRGAIISASIEGDGLLIEGFDTDVPVTAQSMTLELIVASATITNSSITFFGIMPHNSYIRLVATVAVQTSARPVFAMDSVLLTNNATLIVEHTVAQWVGGTDDDRSFVMQYITKTVNNGVYGTGIKEKSAMHFLNTRASQSLGILAQSSNGDNLFISGESTLTIDYTNSNTSSTLSGAILAFSNIFVSGDSLLRISYANVTTPNLAAGPALVYCDIATWIDDNSVFIIQDCNVADSPANTPLFHYMGLSKDPDATVAFIRLIGAATGQRGGSLIPTISTNVYAVMNINNVTLYGQDYPDNGINIDVNQDPMVWSGGGQASWQCIPVLSGPNEIGYELNPFTRRCEAICKPGYYAPSCTSQFDPIMWYGLDADVNNENVRCAADGCAVCPQQGSIYECFRCNDGYYLDATFVCRRFTSDGNRDRKDGLAWGWILLIVLVCLLLLCLLLMLLILLLVLCCCCRRPRSKEGSDQVGFEEDNGHGQRQQCDKSTGAAEEMSHTHAQSTVHGPQYHNGEPLYDDMHAKRSPFIIHHRLRAVDSNRYCEEDVKKKKNPDDVLAVGVCEKSEPAEK